MDVQPNNCVRDVIVLTDGSVSNTKQVLKYCKSKKKHNRVWGIGIGSGCSTGKTYFLIRKYLTFLTKILSIFEQHFDFLALVDGISQATDAESIYVKDNDRMSTKVMQLAQFTIVPQLKLNSLKLPQLEGKVELEGLGHDAGTQVKVSLA